MDFHKVEGWGKAHPVALGLGVFVLGLLVLWLLWPSSPAPVAQQSGPSDAYYAAAAQAAQSGNALQAANLQAQAEAGKTAAELQAALGQQATDLQIADLGNKTSLAITGINAETDRSRIAATAQSTDLASTLTAQVQGAGIEAQRQIGLYSITGATEQAQIASNTAINQAYYAYQAQNSAYAAQTVGYLANRDASIAGSYANRDASIAASQYGAQAAMFGDYWDAQKTIAPVLIGAQQQVAQQQWAAVMLGHGPIEYTGPLGDTRTGIAPSIPTDVAYANIDLQSAMGSYSRQVFGIPSKGV